jgi:PDZ domain-containing protein
VSSEEDFKKEPSKGIKVTWPTKPALDAIGSTNVDSNLISSSVQSGTNSNEISDRLGLDGTELSKEKKEFSVWRTLIVALIGGLLLAMYAATSKSGFALVEPGPVHDVSAAVVGPITDPTFPDKGRFYLTTIKLSELTWAQWVRLQLEKDSAADIAALGRSVDVASGLAEMGTAKSSAYAVALASFTTGRAKSDGVIVLRVEEGSPAASVGLRIGDVITKAGDVNTYYSEDLVNAVTEADGNLELTYLRESNERTVLVKGVGGKDKLKVLVTTAFKSSTPLDVPIDGVAGSSGGLIFALSFADSLDEGDLTAGKKIAGTGTIDITGAVGGIVGVGQKVNGAFRDGATVFFAPAVNYPEAIEAAPEGIKVVPVTSYADAVKWLCDNGATSSLCAKLDTNPLLTPLRDRASNS